MVSSALGDQARIPCAVVFCFGGPNQHLRAAGQAAGQQGRSRMQRKGCHCQLCCPAAAKSGRAGGRAGARPPDGSFMYVHTAAACCTEVGLCPGAAAERPPPLTRGRRRQLASCGTQAEVQSFSPCVAPPATSSCGPGKWGMRHATATTCVVEMPNAISSKLSTSRHVRQSSRGSQLQPLLAPPATST